jgi:hypothetical protein
MSRPRCSLRFLTKPSMVSRDITGVPGIITTGRAPPDEADHVTSAAVSHTPTRITPCHMRLMLRGGEPCNFLLPFSPGSKITTLSGSRFTQAIIISQQSRDFATGVCSYLADACASGLTCCSNNRSLEDCASV